MEQKTLYITIDTEMDADIHWKKGYPAQFSSVLEGIPDILRPIWNQYGVTPIYFVSPEVIENDECCKILRGEQELGAIIGAHLHPEYIGPQKKQLKGGEHAEFPCFAYDREVEKQKLENLTLLIEEKMGKRPVWYRAARFGADQDTIEILKELGYKYDSSFTPCIDWSCKQGPDHSATLMTSYFIDGSNIYQATEDTNEIREFPVTIMGKRWGILGKMLPSNWLFYKWLRPSHMTYMEQKHMLQKLDRTGVKSVVMMFHSMEVMIGKTPYVRNKWMQKYFIWRLRKTINFAIDCGYSARISE